MWCVRCAPNAPRSRRGKRRAGSVSDRSRASAIARNSGRLRSRLAIRGVSLMSRSPCILAVSLIGLLTAGVVRADEEPTFRDRPLSTWIAVLTGDKEVKHRQGALIALEQIGPLK